MRDTSKTEGEVLSILSGLAREKAGISGLADRFLLARAFNPKYGAVTYIAATAAATAVILAIDIVLNWANDNVCTTASCHDYIDVVTELLLAIAIAVTLHVFIRGSLRAIISGFD